MRLSKVISGGQTGVDRAALDAALELDIPHGGWCPRGRKAEDGRIPSQYLLEELDSSDYRDRTAKNIAEADVTLVLSWGPPTGGTKLTVRKAAELNKVCHRIDLLKYPDPADAVKRLQQERGSVLNVAGPRESKRPRAQAEAKIYLLQVFRELT